MPSEIIQVYDDKWDKVLAGFGLTDIYFSSSYHKSFETSQNRTAKAYYFASGKNYFFFPFMISEIGVDFGLDKKFKDIETVYGYSGALSSSEDSDFINEAWVNFQNWAKENNVLCMLVRCNPVMGNYKLHKDAKFDRNTICIDLHADFWANYHPKLRNDIKQANKIGLEFQQLQNINQFKDLYRNHMKFLGAQEFYQFEQEHYDYLNLSQDVRIYSATFNSKIIAAASFMFHNNIIHYHLSASDNNSEHKYAATKFLIDKVISRYAALGYKYLHLGGGRTASADDSLFFFKKRFGGSLVDFYLAKTILLEDEYKEISNEWEKANSKPPPQNYLQFYRIK